jgi:glycosyltransferase involved in cell wall biosynthesis
MSVVEADVCLIVEGAYPYVTGGVSSWVHDLIGSMPDLTFSLFHLAGSREERPRRYRLPPNVVSFLECFVQEPLVHRDRRPRWSLGRARQMWRTIGRFHAAAINKRRESFEELMRGYACPRSRVLNTADLLLSRRSWRALRSAYQRRAGDSSFIDYFWNWRAVHMPIFQVVNAETPPAKVYHAVSTGYAGLAGVVAKIRSGRPLLLTEHGIYVRERGVEISRADWIYAEPEPVVTVKTRPALLKRIWSDMFRTLGQLCYDNCDEIFTLYRGNQELQRELGADPRRLRVIPNGIKIEDYAPLRRKGRRDGPRRVGFVGRVVPIKDVRCFIKACKLCQERLGDVRVEYLILGPADEDPQYQRECRALVNMLGMQDRIKFCGRVDMRKYYPELDVLVLTSISEGQPLTILEAACAGVPTVATDVGGCSELLLGDGEQDRRLGPSGVVTRIGDPTQTGSVMAQLLTDEGLRQRMIEAGVRRVQSYYRHDQMIARYREIYDKWSRGCRIAPRSAA